MDYVSMCEKMKEKEKKKKRKIETSEVSGRNEASSIDIQYTYAFTMVTSSGAYLISHSPLVGSWITETRIRITSVLMYNLFVQK